MVINNKKSFLFVFSLIIGLIIFLAYSTLNRPFTHLSKSELFEIKKGDDYKTILVKLKNNNIISDINLMYLYGRFTNKSIRLKAGEYLISRDDSQFSIIDRFEKGEVYLHPFTIIEGWTVDDLELAISNASFFSKSSSPIDYEPFINNYAYDDLLLKPEGLFLPETYFFPKDTFPNQVLRNSNKMMLEELVEQWENREPNLPLKSPYEALILASIIEKETAVPDERPRIASVFIERLKQNMRLQTDPTVIYGLGKEFNGDITKKDLRRDTAYNTYTRYGLPPTPISLPGKDSIYAALNPANEKNIYFVASGKKDGRHIFSHTREEHEIAVKNYLNQIKLNDN